MGTWGTAIFDDDQASDFLGDLMSLLYNSARVGIEALDDQSRYREAYNVPAAIACLRALATGIDSCIYSMQRSEVEEWRRKWLQWYDRECVDEWDADDFVAFRRNVDQQFEMLIERLHEWPTNEWQEIRKATTDSFRRHSFRLG